MQALARIKKKGVKNLKKISLLGSTGSIGTQTLDVVRKHNFSVTSLAVNSNTKLLEQQAREFNPEKVCVFDTSRYSDIKARLADTDIKIVSGMDGLCETASDENADIILNSVVGMVGLLPTLTAINAKKNVAIANKETLVAGGKLVNATAQKNNVEILPVDSEHSAILQCLRGNQKKQVSKIILTASGGAFFGKTSEELKTVTLSQALNNPNWSMGNKVTIDSATLMNKGLEYIEAKRLFGDDIDIEIVVHRQSIVHSAVEFKDFSIIAQLGTPDMRIPIQYALTYPDRLETDVKPLSLTEVGKLTFDKPDIETFLCLKTCIEAEKKGGAYPCIVNAVNEVAVNSFLKNEIPFYMIGETVSSAFSEIQQMNADTYEEIMQADKVGREFAEKFIEKNK